MKQSNVKIIHGTLSAIGIIGLVFIGYSLAPTKTNTITNTIVKTVTANHSESKTNTPINFVETNPDEIPRWVKRLNPENPDTQMIINLYEMDIAYFTWEKHRPAIGKIQSICGENKECWNDFGYGI